MYVCLCKIRVKWPVDKSTTLTLLLIVVSHGILYSVTFFVVIGHRVIPSLTYFIFRVSAHREEVCTALVAVQIASPP